MTKLAYRFAESPEEVASAVSRTAGAAPAEDWWRAIWRFDDADQSLVAHIDPGPDGTAKLIFENDAVIPADTLPRSLPREKVRLGHACDPIVSDVRELLAEPVARELVGHCADTGVDSH